jgi:hypothetical protein
LLPFLFTLFLATAFPSSDRVSWMRPESFHLTVGMQREAALRVIHDGGWHTSKAKSADELIVDYADDKSLTLRFHKQRLISVRFELFSILPQSAGAFRDEGAYLRTRHGPPRQRTRSLLVYDNALPNIMVVLNDDPKSQYGRTGLGLLVVRYFDPAPAK